MKHGRLSLRVLWIIVIICSCVGLKVFDDCGDDELACPAGSNCIWRGCDGRKCICQNSTLPSVSHTSCIKGTPLGNACAENSVCGGRPLSECLNKRCTCLNGYRLSENQTHCVPKMKGNATGAEYGQTCDGVNFKCVYDLRCLLSVCACRMGYRPATQAENFADPYDIRYCRPEAFQLDIAVNVSGPECQKPDTPIATYTVPSTTSSTTSITTTSSTPIPTTTTSVTTTAITTATTIAAQTTTTTATTTPPTTSKVNPTTSTTTIPTTQSTTIQTSTISSTTKAPTTKPTTIRKQTTSATTVQSSATTIPTTTISTSISTTPNSIATGSTITMHRTTTHMATSSAGPASTATAVITPTSTNDTTTTMAEQTYSSLTTESATPVSATNTTPLVQTTSHAEAPNSAVTSSTVSELPAHSSPASTPRWTSAASVMSTSVHTRGIITTVGLGDKCEHKKCVMNSECVIDACNVARCRCQLGYADSPDATSCWKLSALGEKCSPERICQGHNSQCSDEGTCECEDGYEASDNGRWCRLKSSWFVDFPVVGEECSGGFFSQCYMEFEQQCAGGKCQCNEGFHEIIDRSDKDAVYPDIVQCRNNTFKNGLRRKNQMFVSISILAKEMKCFAGTSQDKPVNTIVTTKQNQEHVVAVEHWAYTLEVCKLPEAEQHFEIRKIQGAIIGGCVGVVAMLGIVVGVVALVRWKRKGRQYIRDTSSTASTDVTSRYSFKIPRPFAHFIGAKEYDSNHIAFPNPMFDREEETASSEPNPDVVNVGTVNGELRNIQLSS